MKRLILNDSCLILAIGVFLLPACSGVKVKETVKKEPYEYIHVENLEAVDEGARQTGSIWKENEGLFADRRAKNINDILTVNIVESSSAKREATTSTGRDTDVNGGIDAFFGLEEKIPARLGREFRHLDAANLMDYDAQKSFSGTGSTERSGNLKGTITAIVKDVYPNGIMKIEGRRVVTVNNEDQFIMLSGLVRRDDIAIDNTIPSTKIADAVIEYSGEGVVGREQKPGWLTNFVDIIWPF